MAYLQVVKIRNFIFSKYTLKDIIDDVCKLATSDELECLECKKKHAYFKVKNKNIDKEKVAEYVKRSLIRLFNNLDSKILLDSLNTTIDEVEELIETSDIQIFFSIENSFGIKNKREIYIKTTNPIRD